MTAAPQKRKWKRNRKRVRSLQERFDSFYIPEPNTGCWLWESRADRGGYGWLKEIGRKYLRAHRLSWTLHRGEIPPGMCVLHKCDTPACVNPDHLFLGTHLDNARDRVQKGRGRGGSMGMAGKFNPSVKLTEEEVRAIRSDTRQLLAIAGDYGISDSQVSSIRLRKSWRYLEH